MKSYRMDLHKGVNVVGDKAVIPEGFMSFADGIDLRSGMPRPFHMPLYFNTVDTGTICAYEYRDIWKYSTSYREYTAEYLNNRSRVYWTEAGEKPRFSIDSIEADLGAIIPKAPPTAASTLSLVTSLSVVQGDNGTGNYINGDEISYRVAARTKDGVMPPSAKAVMKFSSSGSTLLGEGHSATISWTSFIDGVIGWQIFVGPQDQERFVKELSSTATTWTDYGTYSGSGAYASSYSSNAPYRYFYTFYREINSVGDESGPSYESNAVTAQSGRRISFDIYNDGYWSQDDVLGKTLTFATTEDTYASNTITSASYNSLLSQIDFGTTLSHGLTTGDWVRFDGTGDPNYDGKDIEVVADIYDAKKFHVKDYPMITAVAGSIRPVKTVVYEASDTLATGDYIKLTGTVSSVATTFGVYKATSLGTAHSYTIPLYTDNATWKGSGTKRITGCQFYSGNNGYKYRNLYRTGDVNAWQLVSSVDLDKPYFDDGISSEYLGQNPDSFYEEAGPGGVPQVVTFQPPPIGLRHITQHYGMFFGIDGHTVRWTPTGRPNAWPTIYSLSFPHLPVKLIPYEQSMIVLCTDGIYRIDGNMPNSLSLVVTQAMDGCIAPHSCQIVNGRLLYLSRRGVMSFNGMTAECLTDSRLPWQFWTGTSLNTETNNFWLRLPLATYNYSNMCSDDGIQASNDSSFIQYHTNPLPGVIESIRSFHQYGKYFLYWAMPDTNYGSHTMICIDMQAQDMPITTLPIKPHDVHVSSDNVVYMLAQYDPSVAETFRDGIKQMEDSTAGSSTTTMALYIFNSDRSDVLPYHIRTGANSLGLPLVRKRFSGIKIHGTDPIGTYRVRISIDDRYVCDGRLVAVTNPNKIRQANIPVGSCIGYTIDVELAGDSNPRALEFLYDFIASEVDSKHNN